MSLPAIRLRGLSKTYRIPERDPGLRAALRSLVRPNYRDVTAVLDLELEVQYGEVVGLIGPNGAGKTTTLKMLSGLLHPSSGDVEVAGFRPWERKPEFLRRISMVLGNKSQMLWDIPALDTFHVLGEIYRIPHAGLQNTLDELIALLEMEDILNKPVRNLSLGERMKCELAAGLLHKPDVLFLDEPTLGLDVSMQARLRQFVLDYNRRHGATVILTSHYMADVSALCPRVILIHHGRCRYDGALHGLAARLAPFKIIHVTLANGHSLAEKPEALPAGVDVLETEDSRLTLRTGREAAPAITAELLARLPVADLTVEDPPIEAVMDQIYQGGAL